MLKIAEKPPYIYWVFFAESRQNQEDPVLLRSTNNGNNLAFLVRNLIIDMKKVDNYELPEVIYFQKNEILKFWASEFFLKY